jgi:signal transduction histidine kinase
MSPALLYFNAALTVLLGAVVWRAAPRRQENRALAFLFTVDALTGAVIATLVARGTPLVHPDTGTVMLLGRMSIVYPGVVFIHALPFGEALPARTRRLGLATTLVGLALALHPATRMAMVLFAPVTFFPPFLLVNLIVMRRHHQRFAGRGAPRGLVLVEGVILFRWAFEMTATAILPHVWLPAFPVAIYLDFTLLGLTTFAVLAYATLEHQLFSVRGVLVDVAVLGTAAVVALFAVSSIVGVVLGGATDPVVQNPLLTLTALLPLVLVGVAWSLRRRLGHTILLADPLAARRHEAVERARRATAEAVDRADLIALTTRALEEITEGGQSRFLARDAERTPAPGSWNDAGEAASTPTRLAREESADRPASADPTPAPALPAEIWDALAEHFARPEAAYLLPRRPLGLPPGLEAVLRALPGDLILPVRFAGKLAGLLCLSGGRIDREAALAALALAENLAVKLERSALFQRTYHLQRELEQTRRLATLGTFAAAMAHDVRTPLTSIQLNIEMLAKTVRLPSEDMESLEIALEECRRLGSYVSGVLDYVKPATVAPAPSDLGAIVEEAARQVEPLFSGRQVRLERAVDGAAPRALVDGRRMVQVLVNLLENAAQASEPGATVVVAARAEAASRVTLEVTDRGRGIQPEHLPRVFEPFFTTRPDGTGLGLAIVQKLVRAHGGEVQVSSSAERGTTFSVGLPAA